MPAPTRPGLDEAWLSAVFGGGQAGSNAESREIPSLGHLIFVGETVLQLGVMTWLTQRYPRYKKHSDLVEKRKPLITTEKAASWGQLYKLSGQLNTSNAIKPGYIKPSKSQLFIAYLGALYLSNGGFPGGAAIPVKWIGDLLDFEEEEGPADPASDTEEGDREREEELIPNATPPRLGGSSCTVSSPDAPTPPPEYSPLPSPSSPSGSIPLPPIPTQDKSINALSKVNEKLPGLRWGKTSYGPDHDRTWQVKTEYNGEEYLGLGKTINSAKVDAAEKILHKLTVGHLY